MTNLTGFLPVAFAMLALTPPGRDGHVGLPIRFSGEAGLVEVPLDTARLGWQPQPTRTLFIERREPIRSDDGPDGTTTPEPMDRPVPIAIGDRALMSRCFDYSVYGDLTEERRKVWLLSTLSEKVVAARRRGLSAAEEEKLILAGRGDIKRFLDRIEEMRAEFEAVRKDYTAGRLFLLEPDLRSLAVEFRNGPFGGGSLFAKTLAKIETDRKKGRPREE